MSSTETVLPTDEDLARGVQRGDPHALAALVERHHGPLLGYLYRVSSGDRALAEDWVQDTFLRLLRAVGQYRYPRPFKPWLYAIATNIARDHFKQADTRRTDSETDAVAVWGAATDPSPSPEASVRVGDEARQVAAAMSALPIHQREAVILRYYQGLSLAEIADALDIPVGTVKSRISLGLKQLRAELRDER